MNTQSHSSINDLFQRVSSAYDLERLRRTRLIYIGTGGAASFIEDMTRCGVAEHVLIDPDVISAPNVATQQAYCDDLGKPKVECIATRLGRINPETRIRTYQCRLDEISDAEFSDIAFCPLVLPTAGGAGIPMPEVVLVCGGTDNFYAQARVNRLSLQFGLPSLCAQMYHEGRAAEITFTYPGVTPACHRCILSSRYRAYLEEGFENNVASTGTPIFAAQRLNALAGFIALALLHHGTAHPRWGNLLARIGRRNLVQIRMDPDVPLGVFDRVFGGGDTERILFDEPVWLPQREESPETGYIPCPDCGGTGDLRNAMNTFTDTRIIRKG